jgi:hypothetical protein
MFATVRKPISRLVPDYINLDVLEQVILGFDAQAFGLSLFDIQVPDPLEDHCIEIADVARFFHHVSRTAHAAQIDIGGQGDRAGYTERIGPQLM